MKKFLKNIKQMFAFSEHLCYNRVGPYYSNRNEVKIYETHYSYTAENL